MHHLYYSNLIKAKSKTEIQKRIIKKKKHHLYCNKIIKKLNLYYKRITNRIKIKNKMKMDNRIKSKLSRTMMKTIMKMGMSKKNNRGRIHKKINNKGSKRNTKMIFSKFDF
jgi:aspartate/tyrosine/aromatic aminotransferase